MASIFSLYGNIFVENEDANKKIEETTKKGKNSSTTLAQSLGATAKTIGKVGTAVIGGATAIVTGVGAMATSVADSFGTIDDGAKKVGTSAEEYQKWMYAAKLGGLEASNFEKAMIKQQKAFADAKDGSKAMSEAYQRLGIDINSIGSSGEAFNEVISKLADMEDETTRNALANDIFGKSYADLAPLLAEGSEGIKAWKQEAEDLGGVVSGDMVEAGANFGDMVDRVKTGLGGAFNMLIGSLFPILQQVMQLVLDNMPMISNIISTLAPVLVGLLQTILPIFMDLVNTIFPILMDLINQLLPPIAQIIEQLLPIFTELLALLLPPIIEIVKALLPPLLEILDALMPLLRPLLDLITWAINTILMPVINVLTSIINLIGKGLTVVIKALTPVVKGILTVFQEVFGKIFNVVKVPINFVIDGINTFIKALNKVKVPDWVPGVGGKGINIPLIKKLRVGMDYVPYDEMPSLLHKGEMVLTKEEAREYRQNKNIVVQSNNLTKSDITDAFKEAIKSFKGKVVLDDREVGKFVIDTMEGVIYG